MSVLGTRGAQELRCDSRLRTSTAVVEALSSPMLLSVSSPSGGTERSREESSASTASRRSGRLAYESSLEGRSLLTLRFTGRRLDHGDEPAPLSAAASIQFTATSYVPYSAGRAPVAPGYPSRLWRDLYAGACRVWLSPPPTGSKWRLPCPSPQLTLSTTSRFPRSERANSSDD